MMNDGRFEMNIYGSLGGRNSLIDDTPCAN